jgi:hypothetical protein
MKTVCLFLLFVSLAYSQINFDDYFESKTLRLDYFHTGDSLNDFYSFDELIEEPYWGGSNVNLIDKFNYGKYKFEVYDKESSKLIYSRGYSTLFSEWQTTEESKHTSKTFSETVVFPFPKKQLIVKFLEHNRKNEWLNKFEYSIDPENYFIKPERTAEFKNFEVWNSGDPSVKVDIVIIPEGYTAEELETFKNDCDRFAGYLFNCSPYKENKDKFNI